MQFRASRQTSHSFELARIGNLWATRKIALSQRLACSRHNAVNTVCGYGLGQHLLLALSLSSPVNRADRVNFTEDALSAADPFQRGSRHAMPSVRYRSEPGIFERAFLAPAEEIERAAQAAVAAAGETGQGRRPRQHPERRPWQQVRQCAAPQCLSEEGNQPEGRGPDLPQDPLCRCLRGGRHDPWTTSACGCHCPRRPRGLAVTG